jgi:hypothetical protein
VISRGTPQLSGAKAAVRTFNVLKESFRAVPSAPAPEAEVTIHVVFIDTSRVAGDSTVGDRADGSCAMTGDG